ncbi:hypothetical protein H5410_056029, partial [Solanum commersonii]
MVPPPLGWLKCNTDGDSRGNSGPSAAALCIRDHYGNLGDNTIVPIALRRNGSYDDMISSVIETGELACEPSNLVISYQMNEREKNTFHINDRHVSLYKMDIAADGSRPILRINVIAKSQIEPTNSFNNNDSVENENLGDQPKESFVINQMTTW